MQSEKDKILSNLYDNIENLDFEPFLNKLKSIELNAEYQYENYSNKLISKFQFLKEFIKIPKQNDPPIIKEIINNKLNKADKQKKIAIIYHYPCFDGSYSAVNAYIYYKHFSNKTNKVDFFPMTNSQRLEEIFDIEFRDEYKKVYLFDKGFNQGDFQFLYEVITTKKQNSYNDDISCENSDTNNYNIIIVDHHISSIEVFYKEFFEKFNKTLGSSIAFVFDQKEKRSACGITYELFHLKALRKLKSLLINKEAKELFNQKYELYRKYFSDEYKRVFFSFI